MHYLNVPKHYPAMGNISCRTVSWDYVTTWFC